MSGTQNDDDDLEIEIELVDDTPDADKGKAKAPEVTENDDDITITDDEVKRYHTDAQKRINQLTFKANAERRAKEAAAKDRDEAVKFTNSILAENKRLKELANRNEAALVEQAKARAETQVASSQQAAKQAFEAGDTEAFLKHQEAMARHVSESERFSGYRPAPPEPEVPIYQPPVQVNKPDDKAEKWFIQNPWFAGRSSEEKQMKALAMATSDELIHEKGVDPRTDQYYEEINRVVRQRFPEKFQDKNETVVVATARASSVVAPANRSGKAASKVQLTPSQVRLAKRLNLTLEQYAAQVVRESSQ